MSRSLVLCGSAPLDVGIHSPFQILNLTTSHYVLLHKQKYLGLVFDSQLRWCEQVVNVCKKMSYYIHLVNCYKKELPDEIIKLLMNSLVSSHLYYAFPVWGPFLLQCHVTRIQQLQNHAVRLMYRLHTYDHITEYYIQPFTLVEVSSPYQL